MRVANFGVIFSDSPGCLDFTKFSCSLISAAMKLSVRLWLEKNTHVNAENIQTLSSIRLLLGDCTVVVSIRGAAKIIARGIVIIVFWRSDNDADILSAIFIIFSSRVSRTSSREKSDTYSAQSCSNVCFKVEKCFIMCGNVAFVFGEDIDIFVIAFLNIFIRSGSLGAIKDVARSETPSSGVRSSAQNDIGIDIFAPS